MEKLDIAFNLIGLLVSIIFIVVTVRSMNTDTGAIFKRYYKSMLVASIIFGLGFLAELGLFIGMNEDISNSVHHILLIISGIILIYGGIVLPKEAVEIKKVVDTLS